MQIYSSPTHQQTIISEKPRINSQLNIETFIFTHVYQITSRYK